MSRKSAGPSIPGLDVSKIITGVFGTGFIPNLPAGQITSGTFGAGLIPGIDASKIITGQFGTGLIPNLPISQILTLPGQLATGRGERGRRGVADH